MGTATQRQARWSPATLGHGAPLVLLVPLVLLATVGLPAPACADPWKRNGVEDGVLLETREVPGQAMPEFRGIATIPGDLLEITAILDDLNRYCDWNQRCVKTREYQRISDTERIFYTRSGAPWPFDDRDAVVRGTVSFLAGGAEVLVRFTGIDDPRWPPVPGCVRMPLVKGLWRMTRLADGKTRVEYQVQADPGGIVPAWAARLTAKQVPRDTLAGLRRHIVKVKGKYQAFIDRWRPPGESAPPAAAVPAPVTPTR